MPREMTLNDPLSGAEIKMICVQKFAEALDKDCTLADDITYPGFNLKFSATIMYVRSATPGTLVWGDKTIGEKPQGEVDTTTIGDQYETNEPNRAREDNDLPIPVIVQTPSGPKREKVRFDKSAYGKQKK